MNGIAVKQSYGLMQEKNCDCWVKELDNYKKDESTLIPISEKCLKNTIKGKILALVCGTDANFLRNVLFNTQELYQKDS